jgi:ferric-dicitrate binding protein FerR (iron transport regulator)
MSSLLPPHSYSPNPDDPAAFENILQRILSIDKTAPVKKIPVYKRFFWAAAAIFLVAAAGTTYFLLNKPVTTVVAKATVKDIAPGREGARLKLSDGRVILVDTAHDGLLASEGSVHIFKKQGKIIYEGSGKETLYNEIITDKGKFTTAELPDGSFVWLNAASSIRYPLQFSGSERKVAMTGQASFLVTHNASMPFRVAVRGQEVEDIGTEFDINAYTDEPYVKTTLISGAASVTTPAHKEVLHPGQQAVVSNGSDAIQMENNVNTDDVIAWRNGRFKFEDADIETVMRQLARWYDINVVYEEPISRDLFHGGTFRNKNLSEVLKVLELNGGVHFELDGRKLIVKP